MQSAAPTRRHCVYWIFSPSEPSIPLYVGVTCDLKRRWMEFHRRAGVFSILSRRVAKNDLAIREVFFGVMSRRDAFRSEARHIRRAIALNPSLLNKRLPSGCVRVCVEVSR